MNIEFHTPYKTVSENLVNEIRKEMLGLLHMNKSISRAEVSMRKDDKILSAENKICGIRLTVYGDELVVNSREESFEKSAKEAIKDLKRLVMQQVKRLKDPPGQVTSTVRI